MAKALIPKKASNSRPRTPRFQLLSFEPSAFWPSNAVEVNRHLGAVAKSNFVGLSFYTPQPAAPSYKGGEYRASLSDRFDGFDRSDL